MSTSAKLSVNSVEPLVVSLSNYPQSDIRHYFFSLPLLFISYFLLLSSYSLLFFQIRLSSFNIRNSSSSFSKFTIRHSQFNFCGEHFGRAQCKLRRTIRSLFRPCCTALPCSTSEPSALVIVICTCFTLKSSVARVQMVSPTVPPNVK